MAGRGKRILIGLGIGCATLLVLASGSCVTFFIWINQPGVLLEPDRLVGGETSGYVEATLRLDDPGTEQIVERLLEVVNGLRGAASDQLPGGFAGFFLGLEQRRNERQLRQLFPMVVAWGVRPGEDPGDDLHLFAVSLEQHANRLRFSDWLIGLLFGFVDEIDVVKHNGEKLYHAPDELTFFLRGSTLFFATDIDTARRAVDALNTASAPAAGPSDVQRLLGDLPVDATLRGAVSNENDQLARLWDVVAEEQDLAGPAAAVWSRVRALTVTGNFDERAGLHAQVALLLDGRPDERLAAELGDAIARAFSGTRVPVQVDARPQGDRVLVDLHVDDLPGVLEAWLPKISIKN